VATEPLTVAGCTTHAQTDHGQATRHVLALDARRPSIALMASRQDSDGELVRQARVGDSSAWDALVDRLGSRVWAVARAHRLSKADAEDVFQVTWMRLVTHIDRIREPEQVGAWLASTARHESLRVLKRLGRQVPTGDEHDLDGADVLTPPPEARLVATERQLALWKAIAAMPDFCQRLLRLFLADPPPSYEEITIALGRPQGSIGPTRRRCLEKLRRLLAGINDDAEGSRPEEVSP
jgi:RNA polymerase sigma factor (sigma-70 family)